MVFMVPVVPLQLAASRGTRGLAQGLLALGVFFPSPLVPQVGRLFPGRRHAMSTHNEEPPAPLMALRVSYDRPVDLDLERLVGPGRPNGEAPADSLAEGLAQLDPLRLLLSSAENLWQHRLGELEERVHVHVI